jgi:hypothetical protein
MKSLWVRFPFQVGEVKGWTVFPLSEQISFPAHSRGGARNAEIQPVKNGSDSRKEGIFRNEDIDVWERRVWKKLFCHSHVAYPA